ncbi:MAG: SdpI family protein [Candidatus Aenigmarchaeota archaeon]|nr:SdpI family protein [Candidatus Aenigmarchaeota archaeon]
MESLRAMHIATLMLLFLLGLLIFCSNKDSIPIHWNINGEPDRYSGKLEGSFLMPLTTLFLYTVLIAVPRIDPLRENIKKFRKDYGVFIEIFMLLMVSIQALIALWVYDIQVRINALMSIWVFVLFAYLSSFLKKTKRNWFIGIRTPWTISDDLVWKKTHQLGSKLFLILAFISLGMAFNNYFIYVLLIATLIVTVYLFAFSYIEFEKNKKEKTR